jgi:hypothetical protein
MEPKAGSDIQVVDKRRLQNAENAPQRPVPLGRRAHSVLLGHFPEDAAREFLQKNELDETTCDELMERWDRAQSRIQKLPPLDDQRPAALPLTGSEARADVQRVMALPDCKAAFPEDVWTAQLVEISKIIPVEPSLDVEYAESQGNATLDPANPMSAVKLCFNEKHPTEFRVSVNEAQKAMSVSGVNPSLEVVGLRYAQQGENGPVMVSFMISPSPNIVAITHDQGRYFLLNGYHRVYRLLQSGFSHVPCMLREGDALGRGLFPDEVLSAPRPPLFPDFADPALGIIVPFRAVRKVVRIRPDEFFVPQ